MIFPSTRIEHVQEWKNKIVSYSTLITRFRGLKVKLIGKFVLLNDFYDWMIFLC